MMFLTFVVVATRVFDAGCFRGPVRATRGGREWGAGVFPILNFDPDHFSSPLDPHGLGLQTARGFHHLADRGFALGTDDQTIFRCIHVDLLNLDVWRMQCYSPL